MRKNCKVLWTWSGLTSQPNVCPQITSLLTKIIVNPSPLKRHCGQIKDLIVFLMSQSCSNATMGSIRSPAGLLEVFDIFSCCLLYLKESSWRPSWTCSTAPKLIEVPFMKVISTSCRGSTLSALESPDSPIQKRVGTAMATINGIV